MSAQTLSAPALPLHDPLLHRPVDFAGAVNTDGAIDGREGQPKLLRAEPSKDQCVSIMPGQTTSQPLLVSWASSMVGREIEVGKQGSLGSELDTVPVLKSVPGPYVKQHSQNSSISSQLFRRDSASTFTSADSSPTTTVSTMDSALTEPSPSSSPESATSMLPITTFKSLSTTSVAETGALRLGDPPASPFSTLSGLQRADSPGKKMRNMKNLSVNTSASTRQAPQLPKLSFRADTKASGNHAVSAPPTPSFIVPPKPPRKRPSNLGLSITTPESSASSQANDSTIQPVPATPADPQPRMIRYLQTSSAMPVVSSPTVAPEGGMRLPPFGNASIPARANKSRPPLSLSRHSSVDSQASPIRVQMLEHVQEESDYDLPLSREAKSPAYPQGPVCIYDPLVYLYLEPNDTEACDFDVVLNVAREVRNPFEVAEEEAPKAKLDASQNPLMSLTEPTTGRDSIPEPQSAISHGPAGFASESTPDEASSTPKASRPKPEYIHIPWDHNTNLVDDLLSLCELIDKRVQDGKRVLVHCQCGVSRSASLIVAYGLYKNPELSVQEAYDAVKNRSKWIGPNMNLIYQLNEFRGKLPKPTSSNFANWSGWKNAGSGRSSAANSAFSSRPQPPVMLSSLHRNSYQEPSITSAGKKEHESTPVRANSFSPPGSAQFTQAPALNAVSPGPSSAPPDVQWSPGNLDAMDSTVAEKPVQEPEKAPDTAIRIEDKHKQGNDPEGTHQTSFTVAKSTLDMIEPAITEPLAPPKIDLTGSHPASLQPPPSSSPKTLPGGFSSIPTRKQAPRPLAFRPQMPQVGVDRSVVDDVPKTPSLLSPRAAEFTATPFHRTVAGDLAGSSVFEQASSGARKLSRDEDPRSPVQTTDAGTVRNIFDVL